MPTVSCAFCSRVLLLKASSLLLQGLDGGAPQGFGESTKGLGE